MFERTNASISKNGDRVKSVTVKVKINTPSSKGSWGILKKRLAAYAGQYPDQCRQTDTDPDTGCMEFEIRKGRFSFRLTAPYREERRRAASEAAKAAASNLTRSMI